jgi:hypothetical protein
MLTPLLRLAFITNTVFVTLIFCGGLPIMLPFATFTIYCCRWLDRWSLLKETPQPPAHDERLTESFRQLMTVAVFMNVFVTSYMFGNGEIIESSEIVIDGVNSRALEEEVGGEDSFLSTISERFSRANVFPLASAGLLYSTGALITVFVSPHKVKRLVQLMSRKKEESLYFDPGFNSAFHALLTEEQKTHVRKTKDLNKEDKDKGYRLNKANPNIVNRVNADGELLLTWEVAKLDGFLHTYDIAQNERYEAEVGFIHSFLENFKSLGYDAEQGGGGGVDQVEHQAKLQELQKKMLGKVKESDQKALSAVAANKWVGAIKLKREEKKVVEAREDLKKSRYK